MKKIIDDYFNKNYKFLLSVVHNINGGTNNIPYELHKDLVDDLYLYLIDKPDKIEPYITKNGERGLEAFCVRWIKNQSYWISDFKKQNHLVSNKYIPYEIEKDTRIIEEKFDKFYDEYYSDLLNIHSEEQIEKIILSKSVYNNLEQYEKNLYDMYIVQNLNYEQISNRVGISKGTVHALIKKLRRKMKKLLK